MSSFGVPAQTETGHVAVSVLCGRYDTIGIDIDDDDDYRY